MKSEVAQVVAATATNNAMKRLISLVLLITLMFSLCACAPDNIVTPNAPEQTPEQTPSSDTDTQTQPEADTPAPEYQYITANKQKNTDISPTLSIDLLNIAPVKISDLKAKTISFFTPVRNAFYAGELDEKAWFDAVREQYDIDIRYTLRSDNTLYNAQVIAQKSGKELDIITTLISNIAPSRSLMKSALELTEDGSYPFSERVYNLSGKTVFTGIGNSKMLWYNTDIVSDASAYTLFDSGNWNYDSLSLIETDKIMLECGNWAAFGSASGTQATGLAEDGSFTLTIDSDISRETFAAFSKVFDTVANEKETFGGGSVAFCFTDTPATTVPLSFVPIPAYSENGKNIAELSGVGMGISKTADEFKSQYALTFALLWSARYSEWRQDFLLHDCKLTADKADSYIAFSEQNGGLYNADREIAAVFETKVISEKLYMPKEQVLATFAHSFARAGLLNGRKQ